MIDKATNPIKVVVVVTGGSSPVSGLNSGIGGISGSHKAGGKSTSKSNVNRGKILNVEVDPQIEDVIIADTKWRQMDENEDVNDKQLPYFGDDGNDGFCGLKNIEEAESRYQTCLAQ
ncbi:hypothetical protein DITRI_Ditri05aG0083500 [Diplodiscus trichospermus]